jgi:hypothetical protein
MKQYRKLDGDFSMRLIGNAPLKDLSKEHKCKFKKPAIGIGKGEYLCGIIWEHPCGEWVLTLRHSITKETLRSCLVIMSDPMEAIRLMKEHKGAKK